MTACEGEGMEACRARPSRPNVFSCPITTGTELHVNRHRARYHGCARRESRDFCGGSWPTTAACPEYNRTFGRQCGAVHRMPMDLPTKPCGKLSYLPFPLFSSDLVRNLCASIPPHLRAVIAAVGGHMKWCHPEPQWWK